jgi:hypothetical protein
LVKDVKINNTTGGSMKIKIVVTKRQNYGRDLFYIENEKDKWLNVIYNQKSLTEYDIKYLKSTGGSNEVTK